MVLVMLNLLQLSGNGLTETIVTCRMVLVMLHLLQMRRNYVSNSINIPDGTSDATFVADA